MSQMLSASVTTPGTPNQLIATASPALAAITGLLGGTVAPRGSCLVFQADPTNTAAKNIYIGQKGMNAASRAGVGMILAPGVFSPPLISDGSIDLGDFYIDVDAAATIKNVLVSIVG